MLSSCLGTISFNIVQEFQMRYLLVIHAGQVASKAGNRSQSLKSEKNAVGEFT